MFFFALTSILVNVQLPSLFLESHGIEALKGPRHPKQYRYLFSVCFMMHTCFSIKSWNSNFCFFNILPKSSQISYRYLWRVWSKFSFYVSIKNNPILFLLCAIQPEYSWILTFFGLFVYPWVSAAAQKLTLEAFQTMTAFKTLVIPT